MDWQQIVLFAILGLGAGALIAGIAIGSGLSYRGAGVINLSTGAVRMRAGSLIAGIAIGIVLSYRGSGIINLSTGAVAMLAGYCYWSLRTGTAPWGGTPGFGEAQGAYLSTATALL